MVVLKTRRELALMRDACRISAEALQIAGEAVKPGVTTAEIDRIAYSYIVKQGATPNFLHLYGFPATACISINDEVIHGIPSKERVIHEGDIVSIDLGAALNGFNGDNAATFAAGAISPDAKRLMTRRVRASMKASARRSRAAESAISAARCNAIARNAATASSGNTPGMAWVQSFMRIRRSPISAHRAVVCACYQV